MAKSKAAAADPAAEARGLVAALEKVQWADPKKYSSLPEARAILKGSPELQAAAAREIIEYLDRLRDKIPGKSITSLLNMHFTEGYSQPLNYLLRDLLRKPLPLSEADVARSMAVLARYQHLMLSAAPVAAVLSFAERATSLHPLDEKTRKNAGKIAKALRTCGRAAEARAAEKFDALAAAR